MTTLRFVSGNPHKIVEAQEILSSAGVSISPVNLKISELQAFDVRELVKDKCVKAFHRVGRPLFVEHTSLSISVLNGFPSGHTQVFWDTLQAEKVSKLFGNGADRKVVARTCIGFCDGKQIHYFEGEIEGEIASSPAGSRDFQWDCVFIPKGHSQTFAEMGKAKNLISMRRIALDNFATFLRGAL
jgi:XTP/dITP diphosphohydrolase